MVPRIKICTEKQRYEIDIKQQTLHHEMYEQEVEEMEQRKKEAMKSRCIQL